MDLKQRGFPLLWLIGLFCAIFNTDDNICLLSVLSSSFRHFAKILYQNSELPARMATTYHT
uniref:Uncharacterized protein n=1 Tax=Glossina brevipalpis TaxID=37001 RepID=A0A1A9W0I6_9MUSC